LTPSGRSPLRTYEAKNDFGESWQLSSLWLSVQTVNSHCWTFSPSEGSMRAVDVLLIFRDVFSSFFETLYRLRAILLLAPLLVLGFANDQAIDIAREYSRAGRQLGDRFDFLLLTLLVSAAVPLLFIPYRAGVAALGGGVRPQSATWFVRGPEVL
jgi:hypothetical protein